MRVQEKDRGGELYIIKVKGEDNVAGDLTKHVDGSKLEKYMNECVFMCRDGGHELCPFF